MAASSALLFALVCGPARAAEPTPGEPERSEGIDHAVPAVEHAFEIGIGGGFLQGAGDIGDGMNTVQDLSGPGGGGELQLGYRPIASLAFGVFGGCSTLETRHMGTMSATSTTATAGMFASWHFRPERSMDPWVALSTGWRGFWIAPESGRNTSLQGFEVARLQVGLDYRITPEVAIAPVIGASMSLFLTQDAPATSGYENIGSPSPNFFFFAGLQARFDLFGTRAASSL